MLLDSLLGKMGIRPCDTCHQVVRLFLEVKNPSAGPTASACDVFGGVRRVKWRDSRAD